MSEENRLIKERLRKLKELKENNVNPYPYNFDRTHYSLQIKEAYEHLDPEEHTTDPVSVAGRIMAIRKMGKAAFVDLQDEQGKLQIYLTKEDLKEEFYNFKRLDIGDWIGVKGHIFRTKMGEISVHAKIIQILCKSLRPLPEKYHGLKDTEIRYRKRELDLIMNPDVRRTFIIRSKVISATREFLENEGFLEVELPTLQTIYGGANAKPFKTHINAWDIDLFLSVSPELFLKRLVVGGLGPVYTITKNFRNEGVDKTHNPEFTLMECYKPFVDYNEMMRITEQLFEFVAKKVLGTTKINYQGTEIELKAPWKRLSMYDAVSKEIDRDVNKLSDDEIKQLLKNYNIILEEDYSRGIAIMALFEELCEHKLVQPTHLVDHPLESTPLCKEHRTLPGIIERFESFINGWEVSNAYSELNNPIKQKDLLEEQEKRGRGGFEEFHPMDKDFVEAIETGLPPTGGLGIGMDRMIMLLTNAETIRDVILFPTMKPEETAKNKKA